MAFSEGDEDEEYDVPPDGLDSEGRAPAKPQAGGEFADVINDDIPDTDLSFTIRQGMNAMMWTRDGQNVPDWRTRATFCRMAAEYKIGRPGERKDKEDIRKSQTLAEMIEHAKASPEYRASIVETLRAILDQS